VSSNDPRDRAIEAALRKGAAPLPASAECLDAETLAAWADGGLGQRTLARAEAHMASCARCQTIMAALVGSGVEFGPAPVLQVDRAWWHINLRWMAPLAGVATAVLLWMVVPDTTREAARFDDRAPSPAVAPAPPGSASAPSAASPSPASPSTGASANQKATEEKLARTEPASPPAARQERPEEREVTERARKNQAQGQPATDLLAKAEERSAPVAGVAPAAPPVRQEPSTPEADRTAPAPAAAAPSPPPQAFGTLAESVRAGTAEPAIELSSRDSVVRWRLAGPGIVERSSDGGSSWERLDTGTRTVLAAGSCPSASVCWVVGRGGAVLLTTDARAWRRTSPPSSEDLNAVDARDATTAVVQSAQGQAYQTTDGGVSWTRVP
jgi:Putative zinc-finger